LPVLLDLVTLLFLPVASFHSLQERYPNYVDVVLKNDVVFSTSTWFFPRRLPRRRGLVDFDVDVVLST
jgi:hypothetical protein